MLRDENIFFFIISNCSSTRIENEKLGALWSIQHPTKAQTHKTIVQTCPSVSSSFSSQESSAEKFICGKCWNSGNNKCKWLLMLANNVGYFSFCMGNHHTITTSGGMVKWKSFHSQQLCNIFSLISSFFSSSALKLHFHSIFIIPWSNRNDYNMCLIELFHWKFHVL